MNVDLPTIEDRQKVAEILRTLGSLNSLGLLHTVLGAAQGRLQQLTELAQLEDVISPDDQKRFAEVQRLEWEHLVRRHTP